MGQTLSPGIELEGARRPKGVDHFLHLNPAVMAAMIRDGLNVDMVMNPYQMPRVTEEDEDDHKAEVKPTLHLNNPVHLEGRSVEFLIEETNINNIPVILHKLQGYLNTSVPYYLNIHMCVVEDIDEDNLPYFKPLHPLLPHPISLSLNPGQHMKIAQILPQTLIETIVYLQCKLILETPNVYISQVNTASSIINYAQTAYSDQFLAAMQEIEKYAVEPNFHLLVISLEPALPLPTSTADSSEEGDIISKRGFAFKEMTLPSILPVIELPTYTPSQATPHGSTVSAANSPLYMAAKSIQLVSLKQHVGGGEGLYETLEVFGFNHEIKPPSVVEGNGNTQNQSSSSGHIAVTVDSGSNLFTNSNSNTSALPPDCVICMSSPAAALCMPCRHVCMCSTCAQTLTELDQQTKCPMCREKVTGIVAL